jgi:hypothetical protein
MAQLLQAVNGTESAIRIPGTSAHFLDTTGQGDEGEGRLRYLTGGTGAPLVTVHTVRTQAEHFRHLIPLVRERYTVYALDLPADRARRLLRRARDAGRRQATHHAARSPGCDAARRVDGGSARPHHSGRSPRPRSTCPGDQRVRLRRRNRQVQSLGTADRHRCGRARLVGCSPGWSPSRSCARC